MKRIVLLLLLISLSPVFSLSGAYLLYGFENFSHPTFGLNVIFDTDYDRIKAFANLIALFEYLKGNVWSTLVLEDPIKYFVLDIDTVSLSYGYMKAHEPMIHITNPEDWVLRIGYSYYVISEPSWLWSRTGPFIYGVSTNGDWKLGLNVGDDTKGIVSYITKSSRCNFLIYFGPIHIGNENGLVVKLKARYFWVGFNFDDKHNLNFYGLIKSGNGYIFFKKNYIEFFEKVGKIYAVGRFSEKSKQVFIGYEFKF